MVGRMGDVAGLDSLRMTLTDLPAGARRRTHLIRLGAAVLLTTPLLVVPSGPAQAAASISWAHRAGGLAQPTQVTSARDGVNRLFVVEKAGRVRVVKNGRVLDTPFLDIRSRVDDAGEGGLLSIAFHPHFVKHPFFWAA